MGKSIDDTLDESHADSAVPGASASADDLLAMMAGEEIDRLLAEAEIQNPTDVIKDHPADAPDNHSAHSEDLSLETTAEEKSALHVSSELLEQAALQSDGVASPVMETESAANGPSLNDGHIAGDGVQEKSNSHATASAKHVAPEHEAAHSHALSDSHDAKNSSIHNVDAPHETAAIHQPDHSEANSTERHAEEHKPVHSNSATDLAAVLAVRHIAVAGVVPAPHVHHLAGEHQTAATLVG